MKPRHPIYIPSKGRAGQSQTARMFDKWGVDYNVVVEPQDVAAYAERIDFDRLVVLPDNDRGLVFARNFIKDHSIAAGAERHWQFDDDIQEMRRLYKGYRLPVDAGVALHIAEGFTDRYENIALTSFNNIGFLPCSHGTTQTKFPPFYLNVRCYTCFLVDNSLPNRWRFRYNEDTDMTLQVLADGYCTVLFNAFHMNTGPTNSGGATTKAGGQASVYADDGRLKMARDLERVWPGVVTTKRRFGRPQHVVNWRKFDTPLRRREDIDWKALAAGGADEFGLVMRAAAPVKSPELRRLFDDN